MFCSDVYLLIIAAKCSVAVIVTDLSYFNYQISVLNYNIYCNHFEKNVSDI